MRCSKDMGNLVGPYTFNINNYICKQLLYKMCLLLQKEQSFKYMFIKHYHLIST